MYFTRSPKMIKTTTLLTLLILIYTPVLTNAETKADSRQDMIDNPGKYLKITDWKFYIAARVAIIHHVKIENTADIDYKNIKVKVDYYSNYPKHNKYVSSTSGVLPIIVKANSSDLYLSRGSTLGAGSIGYEAKNIRILSAEVAL